MITKNSAGSTLSSTYNTAIQADTRDFITQLFVDGVTLNCAITKWEITKGSCGSEEFTVGNVIGSQFTAEVKELTQDLKYKEVEVRIALLNNGTYEWVTIGHFFISDVKSNIYSYTVKGYGRCVSKSAGGFAEPTVKTLANIAHMLGIGMGCTVTLDSSIDSSEEISASLYGMTNYQVLQVLASVVGGYAIDTYDGNVKICRYKNTATHSVNAGMMVTLPVVGEMDFAITGVRCIVRESSSDGEEDIPAEGYESGSPVNLQLYNEYMTQSLFDDLTLVGYSYRPAEINLSLGDPRIEGDDVLSVTDADGTVYTVPCHVVTHIYDGGLRTTIQAVDATPQGDSIGTVTPMGRALAEIRSNVVRANAIADEGKAIAQDTNQYFWFVEEGGTVPLGVGTGAHVTEIPQDEFIADPANGGGNLLARSNGIAVRNGITELASFGTDKAQIGKTEESHAEIGKRYFKLIDSSKKEYVHFSDLRGDDGYYTNVETLVRNTQIAGRDGFQQILLMYPFTLLTVSWGSNSYEYPASQGYRLWHTSSGSDYSYSVRFLTPPANGSAIKVIYTLGDAETTKTLTANGTDTDYVIETGRNITVRLKHVYIDDVEVLGVYYTSSHTFVQFTGELIPNEETVTLTYTTNSELTKAFTLGERKQDSKVGAMSFTVGSGTEASGNYSKATGRGCVASGTASEASGRECNATANYSHAEGWETTASGTASHAESNGTQATGDYSHSEGGSTVASGWASHAEGWITNATGDYSHSEGNETTASGDGSHAEGYLSQATGRFSHAEGTETEASGASSHASNLGTVAHYEAQTAIGKYNSNNADSAFEIGNGAEGAPSNAFRVDWNGNVEASGEVKGVVKAVGAITGQVLADKAVASGTTWTNLGSFTLPAGLWIVNIATNFSSNATGYRLLTLATSATSAGTINRTIRLPAVNGNSTAINLTAFCEGGTYYLNAVQNSGSSLTVSARYNALRLGNSVEYL
jgi:hypothetical protein